MKTVSVDLTDVYNALQDKKAQASSNYSPSVDELNKDRILMHVAIKDGALECSVFALNWYSMYSGVPANAQYDYTLRNTITAHSSKPIVFINGIPVEFSAENGNPIKVEVMSPEHSAFPLPQTASLIVVKGEDAIAHYRSDRAKKYDEELMSHINKSLMGCLRRDDLSTEIIGVEDNPNALKIVTTASCYSANGVPTIVIGQTLVQESNKSKLLAIYPGAAYGSMYTLVSLHEKNALRGAEDSFSNKIGCPEYCVET